MRKKLLFSLIAIVMFFGVAEGLLRIAGFQAEQRVERMEFTFPVDDYNANAPQRYLQRDETLFWKPIPGVLGHNSKGFYGPEFDEAKPAGVFRIVCLGDSCTHFGPISYPDILRAYLDQEAPGKFEVINAGCIGYTSFQGRMVLEQQVMKWSPDLVTVYFGWNDHWLARGLQDKDQQVSEPPAVTNLLDNLRLMQLARLLKSGTVDRQTDVMRVEPDDYAANLTAMGDLLRKQDADVWYITAPHAMNLGIPPYLYSSGEISDPNRLVPLHESYNQIVRQVVQDHSATLVDLASRMDTMDKSSLFIEDHVHLSQEGKLFLVQCIAERLKEKGILAL